MEEINLKDLLNYFIKKIPLILIITILIVSIGVSYTLFLKTPLYKGNTTLILVKENKETDSSTTLNNDITLNQKLVATYSEVIKSRRVLNQVVELLDLEYSTSVLASKISVSSVSNTELIKITVSDESNKQAALIANTISKVFIEEISEIYNLENVSIIDKAVKEKAPYNIDVVKETVIYVLAGIVLSSAIIFVVYYFDTSIKSSEEIETKLQVSVIGNVPIYQEKKNKKDKKDRKIGKGEKKCKK